MKRHIYLGFLIFLLFVLPYYVQYGQTSESQKIETSAKAFVELLEEGDFAKARASFDSNMLQTMPLEKLTETWKTLISQTGPFKKISGVRTEKMLQYDVVFVTCEFENTPFDIKVVFNESNRISGVWFVPSKAPDEQKQSSHVRSDPFHEKEVTLGKGEWVLPGTLTLPKGDGPFPAVVLVHGLGPNDRDATIGPYKPFRDLAWGLASQKIAVFRYEKRTKEYANKLNPSQENFTVREETVEDALAAASLLRKTDKIDAKKIFMLGYDLGGTLIPRIGAQDPKIAGFIIMAAGSKPLTDIYLDQLSYIFSVDGTISESELSQLEQAHAQVAKANDPKLTKDTPASELPFNAPASYWLDLRDYHPIEVAKNLKQPILILHGKKDYQITIENFGIWKKALSSRKDVKFKSYPKLNHLFIEGALRDTPREYQNPKHVAGIVIDDIANWIKRQ